MILFLFIALFLWLFWRPLLLVFIGVGTFVGALFAWHRWKCRNKPKRLSE